MIHHLRTLQAACERATERLDGVGIHAFHCLRLSATEVREVMIVIDTLGYKRLHQHFIMIDMLYCFFGLVCFVL